jgi:hypothetical protein
MMTRDQIASYCTSKLGITDSAAVTIAGTFAQNRYRLLWNEELWPQTRLQQSLSVTAGTQDYALDSNFEFPTAYRWDGFSEVLPISDIAALSNNPPGYDTQGPIAAVVQLPRVAGVCQIRLVSIPTKSSTLLVIGKRKVVDIAASDEPAIPGADQCLLEFVMADLCEWLRQYGSAERYLAKAGILLEKMKDMHRAQAGEIRRVIPTEQLLDGSLDNPFK